MTEGYIKNFELRISLPGSTERVRDVYTGQMTEASLMIILGLIYKFSLNGPKKEEQDDFGL